MFKKKEALKRLEYKEDASSVKSPEDKAIKFDHHIRYHPNASCNEGEIAA